MKIPKRIAQTLINSLKGGVVPRIGLPHITVGRSAEIDALLHDVDIIAQGGASFRFIVGKYGSGKSFLLQLIRASALLGCLAAGKCVDSPEAKAAATYADGIGLAFQIRDDVLDATGDVSKLGKTIGSDATNNKTTFLTFMTADEAMAEARKVTECAKAAAADLGGEILCDLADYLLERES